MPLRFLFEDTKMTENGTVKLMDVCLNDLGFSEMALEPRIIVFQRILRDLNIQYRRYYSRKSARSYRRVKKPDIPADDLIIIMSVLTDNNHIEYAKYLYQKRMKDIQYLYKSYDMDYEPEDLTDN